MHGFSTFVLTHPVQMYYFSACASTYAEKPTGYPRLRLRVLLREFALFSAKHPERHRFMQEGTDRGEQLLWLVDTHARALYRATVGLIE